MKQVLRSRITNPQNNVDWTTHITGIVNTATGIYVYYSKLRIGLQYLA